MTANVRIFIFSGTVTANVAAGNRLSVDSVQLLKWPEQGRDALTCDTGISDTSDPAQAPRDTSLAYVQVDPGKVVAYEVNPDGHVPRTPTAGGSPRMSGDTMIQFGPGWTLSVVEV